LTKSFLAKAKELRGLDHVKTLKYSVLSMIFVNQFFFRKKLRINTMKSPIPIKAKEKVSKKDNPIIKVFILDEIFWTISEELEGLCIEK
tara:strand:+ start:68 stop:334 length:267 start_codon:yes stop_codon:yes gene_type:complete